MQLHANVMWSQGQHMEKVFTAILSLEIEDQLRVCCIAYHVICTHAIHISSSRSSRHTSMRCRLGTETTSLIWKKPNHAL